MSMLRSLSAASFALVMTLVSAWTPAWAFDRNTVEITTKSGVQVFSVEIADTEAAREKGLMFRKSLPPGQGMLFDFHREAPVGFWMKNTYIPLDMIFIRANGRIANIAENAKPLSEAVIPSDGPVLAVLEVAGGTARKLGIVPGDRVSNPIFHGR
jgi:uncharacterized membrane protein (UPF0127 family)